MVDGLAFDLLTLAPRSFPIFETTTALQVRRVVALHMAANDVPMHQVSRLGRGIAQKLLGRSWRMGSLACGRWTRSGCAHGCVPSNGKSFGDMSPASATLFVSRRSPDLPITRSS